MTIGKWVFSGLLSLSVWIGGIPGDDKPMGPQIPVQPVVPQPMPQPVNSLKAGERYVIPSDKVCDFLFFPEGIVDLGEKSGPRDWTAVFAGGGGKEEDRTYADKYLYYLKGKTTGKVVVTVIPSGYKDRKEWVTLNLDVSVQPVPPAPGPVPPGPNPPVPSNLGKQFVVVLVDRFGLDPARAAALGSTKFRDYVKSAGYELEVIDYAAEDGRRRADPFVKIASGRGVALPAVVMMDADGTTKGMVRGVFVLPTADTDLIEKIKTTGGK